MFGVRLPLAERYTALLAGAGTERGLLGPREVPRLWERHVLNCAALTELVPADASVCDVGSGAGLPGLVLAIRRPDLRLTLVEPLLRRSMFLEEAVATLGLTGVEVVRARAEALHGSRAFDVVTSRAVAALPRLAAWSVPLVTAGGWLLAMKGASAAAELAEASTVLRDLGAVDPEVVEVAAAGVSFPTTVIRARIEAPARLGWPSRRGASSSRGGSRRKGRAT